MPKTTLLALLVTSCLALAPSSGHAAVYYIAPGGDDANDGSSPAQAVRTFDHVLPLLVPGDELVLVDGTYTRATTGLPFIDCDPVTGNASTGTPNDSIVIRAQNPRMAHLDASDPGDPGHRAFDLSNCSYWQVDGLHVEGASKSGGVHLMQIVKSDHVELRGLLVHGSNTCTNSHLISIDQSDAVLLEESELYRFHRHGAIGHFSTRVTFRRNYVNGSDVPPSCPGYSSGGALGLTFYPSDWGIMENNIVEGTKGGLNADASNENLPKGEVGIHGNRWLGNVALNNFRGILLGGRCWEGPTGQCTWTNQAVDNLFEGNVVYVDKGANPVLSPLAALGMAMGSSIGSVARNNSILGSVPITISRGFLGEVDASAASLLDGLLSVEVSNLLTTHTIVTAVDLSGYEGPGTISTSSLNLYENRDEPIALPSAVEASETDPALGACIVFVPDGSPMKGAGDGGADIGANVLYRYQDGEPTTEPLWDATTGAFPCGAVVAGVNDTPGSACIDVHERLHVNSGGCSLPADYDSDLDGVGDFGDNCSELSNPDQLDVDGDSFGNLCDCDFDQDGLCAAVDINYVNKDMCIADPDLVVPGVIDCEDFLDWAGNTDPSGYDTDVNGDGEVKFDDVVKAVQARNANGGLPGPGPGLLGDLDYDGVPDATDNCSEVANAMQVDSDDDGFGNACDCDFDQNGVCNAWDAIRIVNDFCGDNPGVTANGYYCEPGAHVNLGPETDMNADHAVDLADSPYFTDGYESGVPGPGPVLP